MTSESQLTDTPKSTSQFLGVPVAIVIAGGLIAAAIYFSGGAAGSAVTQGTGTEKVPSAAGNAAAPARPAEPTIGDVREVSSEDHIRGAANAKVTVIEYSDFECPFCKRFHPTMQQLIQEYPNDVRWVYRHFPLDALHPVKARQEAVAAECANELGGNEAFWKFTDRFFEVTPSNNQTDVDTVLPQIAREIGLNEGAFKSCLESGKYDDHIEADVQDAQAAGGRGTPYSVVIAPNGEKFPISGAQPYASVKQVVDKALGS